jgi:hypothetical protein
MSKKALLVFSLGAVAGWTAAKFASGDSPGTLSSSWVPEPSTIADYSEPSATAMPPATEPEEGIDPFSGAFRSALAEVRARSAQLAEQDREVA